MKSTRTTSTPSTGTAKADAYQVITDRILARMEGGQIPWQKPWHTLGAPRNYASGHVYTGVNAFLLHFLSEGLPLFMTFHQAKQKGGSIRKGAKGFPIIYYNLVEKEGEEGKTEKLPFLNYSTVFNVADVEGIDLDLPEAPATQHEPIAAAEAIVRSWAERPRLVHLKQEAYYVPALDYVNMPALSSFRAAEQYYQTLFHELTHSTGHRARLNRPDLAENMVVKGAAGYAREELTAEMGAAFLCGAAGLSPAATDENSAAYLQFWLGKLQEDKTLLIKAASHAQKAANLILGLPLCSGSEAKAAPVQPAAGAA
ncbi:DNA primase [Hymenobacter qilianensis]|uniref:DNA primase n=2 Tax=Hymenobacter qilianensis TaxID=1385715 RepID=A0ACB5PX50_9BACT|nr:zincin-like metallopeptidase domain-containing protein [Hymenobacter qilianensis]QNP54417.1 DUF1738 domain-containing protein [Hymenobacter qilianensis]GGF80403.1 DNA primase [Hymenobacter qilianensis]